MVKAAVIEHDDPDVEDELNDEPEFTGPQLTSANGGRRELTDADRMDFRIDSDSYVMLRPKLSIAVGMSDLLDTPDDELGKLGVGLARILHALIMYVEREPRDPDTGQVRGQELLLQRLNDPRDSLDFLDIAPLFKEMQAVILGPARPTGSRRGSTSPRNRSGRGSGGKSHAKRV